MSKIAALAAKRRQQENDRNIVSTAITEKSVQGTASSVSKLRIATNQIPDPTKEHLVQTWQDSMSSILPMKIQELSSSDDTSSPPRRQVKDERAEDADQLEDSDSVGNVATLRAKPSSFARTLMESCDSAPLFPSESSPSFPNPVISCFNFLKPSPDDVVLKAQKFKGPR